MDWLHPTYAWALLAVPLAIGLFWYAARQRREAFERLGRSPLIERLAASARPRRRRWKAVLATGALLLLALALAGPRYGLQEREVERQGVDLVIALDVSHSMLAEDVAPNRLERAKNEIKDFLDETGGHRIGLVVFAGDAFIQSPLTTDYGAIRLFLDVAEPSLIPTPGTDFETALRTSLRAFEDRPDDPEAPDAPSRSRAVLFVSDGENHIGEIEDIQRAAEEASVTVFSAGVGSTSGTPIPLYEDGQRTFLRDREGELVSTRLEERSLRELSESGAYFQIARTSSALPRLDDALRQLDQASLGTERFETYAEQYQWPLALALVLLATERLIRERRYEE